MSAAAYVLLGAAYGLVAAAQPGPFQAYLVTQTLAHGWRRALPAVLGPLLSDAPIIAVVLLFLTRIPDTLRIVLHAASGVFILYLAWRSYRNWQTARPDREALPPGPSQPGVPTQGGGGHAQKSLAQAAAMNVLGPGPYLFWSLVAGPVVVQAWAASPPYAAGFVLGFYVAMLTCLAAIVTVFGSTQQLGSRVTHGLLGISVLALAVFGVVQLWRAASLLQYARG